MRFRREKTIKKELFKTYLIFITLFTLVTGVVIGSILYHDTRKRIYDNNRELAISIANTVNIYLSEIEDAVRMIRDNLEKKFDQKALHNEEVDDHMRSMLKNYSDIEKIRIIDENGYVLYVMPTNEDEMGNNLKNSPILNAVTREGKWSNVFLSETSGNPLLTLSMKLREAFLIINISMDKANGVLSEIQRDSTIYVFDNIGTVVASTNPDDVVLRENSSNEPYLKAALAGEETTQRFTIKENGKTIEMLGTSVSLKNNWVVTVSKPVSLIFDSIYSLVFILIICLAAILVIGYWIMYVIGMKIENPIERLIAWSQMLSKGDYSQSNVEKSYSELDKLASTFSVMAQNIENREIELNRQKEVLYANNEELQSSNEETIALNESLNESEKIANDANKAKSEFLANMSHELRTPLNGILGFGRILMETELKPEQTDYLSNIIYSGERLLQLISAILDYSKIEAGKLELESSATNLKELVKRSFNMIVPQAKKKGLKTVLKIKDCVPEILYTDPLRLNQILANLLGNSVKFTESGKIELIVEVISQTDEECKLKFSVRDTGIGIKKDMQKTILQMFTQADSSITRKYGGSGLGLTITNNLLNIMNSQIDIDSAPESGSVFSFELIFKKAKAQENQFSEQSITAVEPDFNLKTASEKLHIIIADDDPISLKLMKNILERNLDSVSITLAVNGQEVVDTLKQNHHDLIFLDLRMPVKDGFQVAKIIREDLKNFDIKIVGLSADLQEENNQKALDFGFDCFITKPFEITDILNAIPKKP